MYSISPASYQYFYSECLRLFAGWDLEVVFDVGRFLLYPTTIPVGYIIIIICNILSCANKFILFNLWTIVNVRLLRYSFPFKLHNRIRTLYTGYVGSWDIIWYFRGNFIVFIDANCYVTLSKFQIITIYYVLFIWHCIIYLYYNSEVCVCLSVCLSVCAGFIWKRLMVMT